MLTITIGMTSNQGFGRGKDEDRANLCLRSIVFYFEIPLRSIVFHFDVPS